MDKRHISVHDTLEEYGQCLSSINDKLYHSNIENLFISKNDPKYVQNHIKNVTKSVLENMEIPKDIMQQKMDEVTMKIYWKDVPNEQKKKRQKAMNIDNNIEQNENEKDEQMLMLEMEQINEEIKKLESETNELNTESTKLPYQENNCFLLMQKQQNEIWAEYQMKLETAEYIETVKQCIFEPQMMEIRDIISAGNEIIKMLDELKSDYPDNKSLDFLEQQMSVKQLRDTITTTLANKFEELQCILAQQINMNYFSKEYENFCHQKQSQQQAQKESNLSK